MCIEDKASVTISNSHFCSNLLAVHKTIPFRTDPLMNTTNSPADQNIFAET